MRPQLCIIPTATWRDTDSKIRLLGAVLEAERRAQPVACT